MSNHKNRLQKLERQNPPTDAARIELMKPSEILARADELIQQGAQPTAEQRGALDSIRLAVTQ